MLRCWGPRFHSHTFKTRQTKRAIWNDSATDTSILQERSHTDFADLSSDELIGGFDEIKGKKIRIEGYLEEFSLSRKEADDLIMAAREIVYK